MLDSAGLPVFRSELLQAAGFAHAFCSRNGGISPAPWASLNFATNTGDTIQNVEANLFRVSSLLGTQPEQIYFASQVHGTEVVEVDGHCHRRSVAQLTGDAILATRAGMGCAVRSADCGTLLVGDLASRAVTAIHAGWRGTVLGVVERGISRLLDAAGSSPASLVAVIGPHIERCCFEVGEDVASELAEASPLGDAAVIKGAKPRVDLRSILEAKLRFLGVHQVDHVHGCTVCDSSHFFSYRREGKVSGRLLSVIVSG